MSEIMQNMDQQPLQSRPRPVERYVEISGPDQYGRPKVHVAVSYCDRFSDGTYEIIQELTISMKPIVSVFQHAGAVNVDLDFRSQFDVDLSMLWNLLQAYKRPENSVAWTEEEVDSGYYFDADGNQHMIYSPVIEMTLSLRGKENEFALTGVNPLYFTLAPNNPKSNEACVLQLTFPEDWFFVSERTPDDLDMNEIQKEAMAEADLEMPNA